MLRFLLTLCLLLGATVNCFKENEIRVFPNFLKDEHHEKVFTINLAGKNMVIQVKPTNSNGNTQIVRTQSAGESTFQSRNCFYEGEIVDQPESFVHLYACEFMRGLIQVDETTSYMLDKKDKNNNQATDYFVSKKDKEPLNGAVAFDKFQPPRPIQKEVDPEENIKRMLTNPKGQEFKAHKIVDSQGDLSYTFKIEMIVDTYYFEEVAGRNKRFVTDTITDLIEIVDRPFSTEKISVICPKLTVNDLYDTIIVSQDATIDYLLYEIFYYRTYFLSDSLNYDATYLFSGHPPIIQPDGSPFTRAVFLETICKSTSVGVQLDFIHDNYLEAYKIFFIVTRGFGNQDDTPSCVCDAPGGCIGDPNLDYTKLKKYGNVGLSSCTYDAFRRYAQSNSCLRIRFTFGIMPTNPTCGNWIQEVGEECDCGREENCKSIGADNYCNFRTCKMKSNYDCLEGDCCTADKKFKPKNSICSVLTHSVCDLFEGCSGDHGYCPFDTWALDGTPCGSDKTFTCDLGVCVDNYGTKRSFARKCSQKCNHHGVCNNRWNCHCEPGFVCLDCVPLPGSPGGSIDSGAKCLSKPDEQSLLLNDLIAAVIIILFLNVLPIVSTIGYLVYTYTTSLGLAPSQYGLYSVADF